MADTTIDSVEALVETLTDQHEEVKALMPKVLEADGKERAALFDEVRRTLAVHEALEQETVHLAAESEIGSAEAKSRLEEETEAEQAIAKLEDQDADSEEFEKGFGKLQSDVVEHAESEEHEEFDKLSGELTGLARARVEKGMALLAAAKDGKLEGVTFQEMFNSAKKTIHDAGSGGD